MSKISSSCFKISSLNHLQDTDIAKAKLITSWEPLIQKAIKLATKYQTTGGHDYAKFNKVWLLTSQNTEISKEQGKKKSLLYNNLLIIML